MTNGNDLVTGGEHVETKQMPEGHGICTYDVKTPTGLTKREYFATTIFAGLLANPNWNQSQQEPEDYAKGAPIYADALIEALKR